MRDLFGPLLFRPTPGGAPSWPGAMALFALAYLATVMLGHALSLRTIAVATFWPGSGVLLAALLATPPRRWAWVLATAAAVTLVTDGLVLGLPIPLVGGGIAGNGTEALAGAAVVRLILREGREQVSPGQRLRDTLAVGAAALVAPVAGATLVAWAASGQSGTDFAEVWRICWAADSVGVAVGTPAALAAAQGWSRCHATPGLPGRHLAACGLVAVIVTLWTAAVLWAPGPSIRPLTLTLPPLIWASLRHGQLGATVAVAVLALMMAASLAIDATPYLRSGMTPAERVVFVQLMLFVAAATAQLLAAATTERRAALSVLATANAGLEATVAARTAALQAANAALAAGEARLRLFVDRAPAAIAMFDAEMRYLAVSRRFLQDYRLREETGPEALVGRRYDDVFPHMSDHWREVHRRVLAGETLAAEDEAFPHADGRTDWVRWEMTPWHRADGSIGGALLFSEVVTARRQAEAALAGMNRDLERRVAEEVAAREDAQARAAQAQRMQALGQLAGGIAHDFNNILQAVQSGVTLIAHRAENPATVRKFARTVLGAAERGGAITRRLLAFARHGDLRAERIDMARLLEGLREVLAQTLGSHIAVCVEVGQGPFLALADRSQLETVLVNLATNGRDAMAEGGRLTLEVAAEAIAADPPHASGLAPGRYVRLRVADTGTGMDLATLQRAPEPFFTTKPQDKGTGLGLPMAKGFAEQSGGALAIESAPGQGTAVTLWLPAAEAAAEATPARSAGLAAASPGRRILVVDDEAMVRETLAATLEDAGFAVLAAGGGAAALAMLDAGEAVDALVSDLSMPGMGGLALIRAALQRRPGLPAVLLTGHAGDEALHLADGLPHGACSLLRKPVGVSQLVDCIETLLAAGDRATG
ncbi:Histidine kinase [Rhodovastum atsumiense]|nr:Histidine kinase [Rhodovastum atsumiense]